MKKNKDMDNSKAYGVKQFLRHYWHVLNNYSEYNQRPTIKWYSKWKTINLIGINNRFSDYSFELDQEDIDYLFNKYEPAVELFEISQEKLKIESLKEQKKQIEETIANYENKNR